MSSTAKSILVVLLLLVATIGVGLSASASASEFYGVQESPDIEIVFETATKRTDGMPIENLSGYELYHIANNGEERLTVLGPEETSFVLVDVGFGTHTLQIATVEGERVGPRSKVITVNIPEPVESDPAAPTIIVKTTVCVNGLCESKQY